MKIENANGLGCLRRARWFACVLLALMWIVPGGARAAADAASSPAEQKFEMLQVGSQTFTNVTVVSRSAKQITIMHTKGVASLKLDDLAPDVQAKLGYDPANRDRKGIGLSLSKTFSAQSDRVRETWAKVDEFLHQHEATVRIAAAIGLPIFYFFCCFCFMLVCRKAGVNASYKVWIPLLQFDPLFKAAGMSRISLFWLLSPLLFFVWASLFVLIAGVAGTSFDSFKGPKMTMFVAGLQVLLLVASILVFFVWCFKICIARGKRAWLGVFLILPLTNLLMLCYLAFSRGAKQPRSTGQLKLA